MSLSWFGGEPTPFIRVNLLSSLPAFNTNFLEVWFIYSVPILTAVCWLLMAVLPPVQYFRTVFITPKCCLVVNLTPPNHWSFCLCRSVLPALLFHKIKVIQYALCCWLFFFLNCGILFPLEILTSAQALPSFSIKACDLLSVCSLWELFHVLVVQAIWIYACLDHVLTCFLS